MKKEEKQLYCSICNAPIPDINGWKYGNNAQPVNDGRCCNECNDYIVIPARLAHIMGAKEAARVAASIAGSKTELTKQFGVEEAAKLAETVATLVKEKKEKEAGQ